MDTPELKERVAAEVPRMIDELSQLVAVPSIGYPGYDPAHVRTSAELTREILRGAGFEDARLLELENGHPAVFGEIPGPESAPTLLLYAHHDVQPEGDPAEWTSPPFEPQVRDGRLYGRGSADDKSGVVIHAAALRALGGEPPCTVKVLVEGEEECSAANLPQLVRGHADLLKADVGIVADGGNYRTGTPTIGTSIRGSTAAHVRVDVLPVAQHSGAFGGPLPDAVMALCRIIATLHDDDGNITLPGMQEFEWQGTPVSEEEFREESRVFPEVRMIGTGSIADRTLSKPSINVLAFEAPRIADAANQIVPTARAVVGLRTAPGEDAPAAAAKLAAHLRAAAPWGVRVTVDVEDPGDGYMVDTSTPGYVAAKAALAEAFGREVLEMGSGGSIPIVPMLASALPGIQLLIWGAMDHVSNIHSVDESVDLEDLERMALAEALLIRNLGRRD
jgi:acetylornithine deacetylase/succinyl-diaminopimelate desuccinylase-like protein